MPEDIQGRQATPGILSGLTFRTFFIGVGLTVLFSWAVPRNDLYLGGAVLGQGFLPAAAVFVVAFVSLAINPFLRRIAPGSEFSASELALIWIMTGVGAAASQLSLTGIVPSVMGGLYHYAGPGNKWIEKFIYLVPDKLVPSTDPSSRVIKGYFEGLEHGERIPWGMWVRPLFYWSLLLIGLYVFFFSLAVILRRQWVERERLPFPLVRLPMEMVRAPEGGKALNSFFSSRLMWVGFGISAFVTGMNQLTLHFPSVPGIPLTFPVWTQVQSPPWDMLHVSNLELSLPGIGIAFILPIQIAFSLFFFYLFARFELLMKGVMGYPRSSPREPFMIYQEAGVIVCFVVFTLWLARPHLKEVVRKAISGEGVDDSDEAFSYRTAFWALVASIVGLTLWCRFIAGISLVLSFIFILLFAMICIVLTKVVAQGGLMNLAKGFQPDMLMTSMVKPGVLGPQNLTMMLLLEWTMISGLSHSTLPDTMNSFKLADSARLRRRAAFGAILVVLLLGAVLSFYFHTREVYAQGADYIEKGLTRPPKRAAGEIMGYIKLIEQNKPTEYRYSHALFFFIGIVFMFVVYFFQSRLYWWPFHPIGLVVADQDLMPGGWFTIMIGWFIKRAVLGYGGGRAYTKLMPCFLGLVMGDAFVKIIAVFFLFVTGKPVGIAS